MILFNYYANFVKQMRLKQVHKNLLLILGLLVAFVCAVWTFHYARTVDEAITFSLFGPQLTEHINQIISRSIRIVNTLF